LAGRVAIRTCGGQSIVGYDALIVAGDVYDRAVPPSDDVSLLGNFLQRLAEANVQTIIIAGNHDSAVRLGFADGREHV